MTLLVDYPQTPDLDPALDAITADALIAWWPEWGDDEGTVLDRSPRGGYDGQSVNTARVADAGRAAYARYYSASNSYVDCGTRSFPSGMKFSLAAWLQSDRPSTNAIKYWLAFQHGSIFDAGFGILFYDRNLLGTQGFEVWARNVLLKEVRADGTYNALGGWNHVIGTYDGTTLGLYVNGNLAASGPGIAPPTAPNPLRIGDDDRADASGLGWLGRIYDPRLWNRAISASEVAYIYEAGRRNLCDLNAAHFQEPYPIGTRGATGYLPRKSVYQAGAARGLIDA